MLSKDGEQEIPNFDLLVSIIIPVYNVERYLEKCATSVMKQSYKNIEIILVDDGSTDNSGDICDKIALMDSRIKVIHKENGGLSSARNAGIEIAKGEVLGFIDSDDYVEFDMIEVLLQGMVESDSDMAICGIKDIFNGKVLRHLNIEEYVVDNVTAMKMVLQAEIISVTAVNKLYKRRLFDTVRYPLGKIAEDAFVCLRILEECERVYINTRQLYYYIHRENSITTNRISKKDFDVIDAYTENYKFIYDKHPEIIDEAKMRMCWARFYVLDKIIISESTDFDSEKKEIINELRNNWSFIIKNKTFKMGRKVSVTILIFSEKLYKLCVLQRLKRRSVAA